MSVSKTRLLNLTRNFLSVRIPADTTLQCIYLTGSMLGEDPFLNGTTDVDMVFVHQGDSPQSREIISVSPEITFDIHHIAQSYFTPPRKLRGDPWIGSSLCFDPQVLYGKGHWFEFVQASIEGSFFQPENVVQRAYQFSNRARNSWLQLRADPNTLRGAYVRQYIKILEDAANAVASLRFHPMTDRIFLRQFNEIATALDHPELPGELFGLILGSADPSPFFAYYFNSWKHYLDYFGRSPLVRTYPQYDVDRLSYYTKPVEMFWQEHLPSALWIMLKTWSRVAESLQLDENEFFQSFCSILEIGPEHKNQRANAMENFLNTVENCLILWGHEQGLDDKSEVIL